MSTLDDIKARAEKATPGPWESGHTHGRVDHVRNGIRFTVADLAYRDADFIAHARTDVPKLVAALENVLERCEHMDRSKPVGDWYYNEITEAIKRGLS